MRLGPYELVRQIGAGGMGEVWVARCLGPTHTREHVAIKRLPRRLAGEPNYRRILLEEARLSALLRHPNIVHTIEAGEADGEVFIVMELIDGLDLSRVTRLLALHGERLPISVSAYVVAEILRGLAYAHELEHERERISLVHRDVSPHNVMLSSSGAIKLADFGVARLSSEDTSGTHVKGKARYMPPEQLRGDSRSPTVDLFAVGAVLQELLDGSTFRGDAVDDARLLGMAIDGFVPPPKHPLETPAELEQLRCALLEPDAKQRVQSAEQALALLLRWPGYRPCPHEVAALLEPLREHESELQTGATQTGLANEATFLHTNDLELDASQMVQLARAVEAPDRILVAVPAEPGASASESASGEPPPRDPSLALVLSDASFLRPIPTDVNPVLPSRRSLWPLALGLALVLGGGVLAAHALGLLPTGANPEPPPASTLRQARLAGRGSLLDLGFRDRGMDRVLIDDIHFDYRPEPSVDPLAALVNEEVELALTSFDAFVRAGSPGSVVAVIGAPLGSEGLILDTRDHPQLRELGRSTVIAHSPSTAGLAHTLAGVFASAPNELPDDAAVFAELERDDSELVAGIVREPWLSKARASGMTVLATGLDVPRADLELLVVSERTLASDPSLVEAVVTTYYALPLDPAKLIERAVTAHGISQSAAELALARACLFDGPGAAAWLADETASPPRIEPRFILAAAERVAEASNRNLAACLAAASREPGRTQPLGTVALPETPLFEPGSALLHERAAATLAELIAKLQPFNPATISVEIVGFGDGRGAKGRKLGRARADAIVQALATAGLRLRMSASGKPSDDAPPSRIELRLIRG
jgi:serine/threonine protein kinase/outer membrane protein OmpA-like peptidoglycan-associated protein